MKLIIIFVICVFKKIFNKSVWITYKKTKVKMTLKIKKKNKIKEKMQERIKKERKEKRTKANSKQIRHSSLNYTNIKMSYAIPFKYSQINYIYKHLGFSYM